MELPDKRTELIDEGTNVTYIIVAYRHVSKDEAIAVIRHALSGMKKSKRPKANSTCELVTTIGLRD